MGVADYLVSTVTRHLPYEPTPCQAALFDKLAAFAVQYGESDILLVSGYAGTGKTSAIAAFVRALKELEYKYVLLSPTGRSAKVLSGFTGEKASTIHKHIYRQKSLRGGLGEFELDINKSKDTFFIVDEASLIASSEAVMNDSVFGSGDLLSDLIAYVRAGVDNKLIIIGDRGQLPPIGMEESPALDLPYMSRFGTVWSAELTTVVRQAAQSGILTNATLVRKIIERDGSDEPRLTLAGFSDVERVSGSELIETLSDAIDRYGLDNVVVLCRSNKRANRYNAGIRASVLFREERLTRGDRLMVVKNCYQFLDDVPEMDFIANGDVAVVQRVRNIHELYGFRFADVTLQLPDYDDYELTATVLLDTLTSEAPALTNGQQELLLNNVMEDYADIRQKSDGRRWHWPSRPISPTSVSSTASLI